MTFKKLTEKTLKFYHAISLQTKVVPKQNKFQILS